MLDQVVDSQEVRRKMSARTPILDSFAALVQMHEDFWSTMGAHELAHSVTGQRLGAFLREAWNPWYVNVEQLIDRNLSDSQQAQLVAHGAEQLVAIRDLAGYKYAVPSPYDGDPDGKLSELGESAGAQLEVIRLTRRGELEHDLPHPTFARREFGRARAAQR